MTLILFNGGTSGNAMLAAAMVLLLWISGITLAPGARPTSPTTSGRTTNTRVLPEARPRVVPDVGIAANCSPSILNVGSAHSSSITLTSANNTTYLFEASSGGKTFQNESWTSDLNVSMATESGTSVSIGHSESSTGSWNALLEEYAIGGVAVQNGGAFAFLHKSFTTLSAGQSDLSFFMNVTTPALAVIMVSEAGMYALQASGTNLTTLYNESYDVQAGNADSATVAAFAADLEPGTHELNLSTTLSSGTVGGDGGAIGIGAYLFCTYGAGGSGQLSANAVVTPSYGPSPLNVSFRASPSGGFPPYVYSWTLSDGRSSSLPDFEMTLVPTGTVVWNLTVTDSHNEEAWDMNYLTVIPAEPLKCAPTDSPGSGSAPVNVSFSSVVTGGVPPYTYNWTFGDGNYSSEATPRHDFEAPGTFNVTLTVVDSVRNFATCSLTLVVSNGTVPGGAGFASSSFLTDLENPAVWVSAAVCAIVVGVALDLRHHRKTGRYL